MNLRTSSCVLFVSAGLVGTLVPCVSSAQTATEGTPSRWAVRVEVGGGLSIHGPRPDEGAGDTAAIVGNARLAYRIAGPFGAQASFGYGRLLPNGEAHRGVIDLTLGLRLDFALGRVANLFLDANGGYYAPGTYDGGGIDGGVGFEFRLSDRVGLGPFGRYTRIFEGGDPRVAYDTRGQRIDLGDPHDIDYWMAGLSFAYHPEGTRPPPPPPPPPPADSDHDGVNDDDDRCANTPAGDHPDPTRAGCPLEDADGDEVFDRDDQCPNNPAGVHPDPDRRGCPDSDDDHDGVYNHDDQCPTEAAGVHPDSARRGCPQPDRDHDNIPDAVDHCPDRPGAPSPVPARNGCPGLVTLEAGQIRINRPVFFGNNSDVVLPASFPVLQAVADALRATPEIRSISVEGHTDDVGQDAANLTLSQRRAASVVRWLTQHAVEAARMTSQGFGETRPVRSIEGVPPAQLPAARAANRRVEFRITELGDVPAAPSATPTAPATGATAPQ
jgi:outer membrane protein OmpA-like peptidoglycan-associated protein